MNLNLSQLTPLMAIVVVGIIAVIDLVGGIVLAIRNHETSLQKLPDWLWNNGKFLVPLLAAWLAQHGTNNGSFDSTALASGIYLGALTLAPKFAQDVIQKWTAILTGSPAASSAAPTEATGEEPPVAG